MKIVLAIDGGGIRGIVPATILDYIEKKIQEIQKDPRIRLANLVDLVAGTSTGSIVGSLMLVPSGTDPKSPRYTFDQIIEMYIEMGGDVFEKHFWHRVKTLWGLFGPVYPASNIEPKLLQMLDHYQLKDLIKPCLFTAYDIDRRRADIFTNCDKLRKYEHYYVKDVIRGSTSIPAYFPPAYFQEGSTINTLVDGGVFANNPSLVAYVEASKCLFETDDPKNLDPNKIVVISLGTGASKRKQYPYAKSKKWGMANWVFPILDVMLSGISDVTHYEMQKLFEGAKRADNYKRINPPLEYSTAPSIDASKENITNLIKDANVYIEENKSYLNTLAREIIDINHLITYESMK